jgi:phosphate transport system permease protein
MTDLTRLGRPKSVAARRLRERLIVGALAVAATFSIFVTTAILVVLAKETVVFFGFEDVSLGEFFGSAEWNPLLGAEKHFGIWPLISGTMLVTIIAASIALPIGLITAIYLSEYATARTRAVLKPALEILAGIPTVVYGFFALMFITPALQKLNPMIAGLGSPESPVSFGGYNALSAGIAMGIMILPIVCSLSEDSLRAVPRSLRDGAFALGGTRFDVSVKVVVPAALSGVVAAFLLAISRAIGETMIVVMAAGLAANLTANPLEAVTTVTVQIVTLLVGDQEFDSPKTLAAFALGLVLFLVTLLLNVIALYVVRKYREQYE